jgi:hypothetical protein
VPLLLLLLLLLPLLLQHNAAARSSAAAAAAAAEPLRAAKILQYSHESVMAATPVEAISNAKALAGQRTGQKQCDTV